MDQPKDPLAKWKWKPDCEWNNKVIGNWKELCYEHNAAIDDAVEATAAKINDAIAKNRVADYKDVEQLCFELREKQQLIQKLEEQNKRLQAMIDGAYP